MPKGILKNILDHEILETGNEKTLVFVDSSEYMGPNQPEGPMLEITLPGYENYFLVSYPARQVTTFNSSTIGLNPVLTNVELVPLPDGIYTIKQKVCPYPNVYKVKYHMRVTLLQNRLNMLYRNVDLESLTFERDKELQQNIMRIQALIAGAKAEVNYNQRKAYNYYQTASKLVTRSLDKFCKNCK